MSGSPQAQPPAPPPLPFLALSLHACPARAPALCPRASCCPSLTCARSSTFLYSLNHFNLASQLLHCRGYSNSVLLTSPPPCPHVSPRSPVPTCCLDPGEIFRALVPTKTPSARRDHAGLPWTLSQCGLPPCSLVPHASRTQD